MIENREIAAELWDNFLILPNFNSETTEPFFTIFLHDVEQLLELLMRAFARQLCISFQTREQRVKTVCNIN